MYMTGKTNENYNPVKKGRRTIFDKLNATYAKYDSSVQIKG